MVKSEFFRRQICCIEKSPCDIVGTFRRPCDDSAPHSELAPGELCPPRYAPECMNWFASRNFMRDKMIDVMQVTLDIFDKSKAKPTFVR